jgi:alpha-N-arabinofuranosidase
MKKTLLLVMLIFSSLFLLKSQEKATINFDFSKVAKDVEPNRFAGIFFEYLKNNVNTNLGVGAQELRDRGMDINYQVWEAREFWTGYYTCDTNLCKIEYLWQEGYNTNSNFHNVMRKNTTEGVAGFSQVIMIDNDSDYEFYCYLKGDIAEGKVTISLLDTITDEVLYCGELGPIDLTWAKYSVDIPKITKTNNVRLTIAIADSGYFEVDETSFKSKTSKYNLRKSFIDLIKYAKPGIMRYPGGCFADHPETHFMNAIEPVDKRNSPHFSGGVAQRMEFGINEYFDFCKDLGIEPYLVVNYKNGTPEEAANFVSYCNDPSDKGWGKVRAQNGYEEPFKVKYWEVGNEIWDDYHKLANTFIPFYKAMKEVDPSIQVMVTGDHWLLDSNVKVLFSNIKDSCDIFSWHPAFSGYWTEGNPPENYKYDVIVSWGYALANDFKSINQKLYNVTNSNKIKSAPTEWWSSYEGEPYWQDDRTIENSNQLTALANIQMVHECIKNWETTSLACHTLFIGYVRNRLNSELKRVAYGCGSMYSISMFSNHYGNDFVPVTVNCNLYNMMDVKDYWPKYKNIPYLDVVSTMSEDTLFVSVVNRHRTSKISTTLNITGWQKNEDVMIYEMASENYKDANTADEPLKLFPKRKNLLLMDGSYDLEPHSYTVIAIPRSDIQVGVQYEPKPEFDLSMFPNPASSSIIIDTYGKIMDKIEIFNTQGILIKSLKTEELAAGYVELDLSGFAAGVYMVQAELNGQTISDKFTVRK